MTETAIDYCAGIGGWEVELAKRNIVGQGIENAKHPRAAREANNLETIWDDLETLPETLLEGVRRAVGSFPCQPFSQNLKGKDPMDDPRAHLMRTGLRHMLIARPEWLCLENVSRAGTLMTTLGEHLAEVGYSYSVRVINAADYGLPQARKRALLVARRDGAPIVWPEPTHADVRVHAAAIAAGQVKPWVTMSEALGRTFTGAQSWGNVLPSPAVVGSFNPQMHAPPRYRGYGDVSRQNDPGAIECTLAERMLLQGFPPGWKLAGPKSAQDLQVGNAIPPVLADVALTAIGL